ncbi:MAG: RsmD family RNA methyltransferase [Fidelibacterota bacterium]|nr:MAG: RsmD family RNA methyltransferase [Candidatus Neomarinimicrobiota bacterium]
MKLNESPEKNIRPTKAIVRKSIFQRLEPWIDKEVCDLYAGIGTLGIEALSRGAAHVTFIENNTRALAVLDKNLEQICARGRYTVTKMEARSFLASTDRQYDVVLADPPYHTVAWAELQGAVDRILVPGGAFVMEMPKNAAIPDELDVRIFGKTKVGLWRKKT